MEAAKAADEVHPFHGTKEQFLCTLQALQLLRLEYTSNSNKITSLGTALLLRGG